MFIRSSRQGGGPAVSGALDGIWPFSFCLTAAMTGHYASPTDPQSIGQAHRKAI
ncbi:MAG: hypothetical protein ACI8RN_002893 [Glaciecola sp.]|jgi:hypothetical protein